MPQYKQPLNTQACIKQPLTAVFVPPKPFFRHPPIVPLSVCKHQRKVFRVALLTLNLQRSTVAGSLSDEKRFKDGWCKYLTLLQRRSRLHLEKEAWSYLVCIAFQCRCLSSARCCKHVERVSGAACWDVFTVPCCHQFHHALRVTAALWGTWKWWMKVFLSQGAGLN